MDRGPRLAAARTCRKQRRMNSNRQQVKEIFLAACELEPPRRATFLDQACANAPELRTRSGIAPTIPSSRKPLSPTSPSDTGPAKIQSPLPQAVMGD